MAQEDKGLVMRGLFLLGGIGILVAAVLAIVLWRPQTPPPSADPKLGQMAPSGPGWDIRYNAATALARRGSDSVPWHLIREMLDERQQLRNNLVRTPDGRDVYDEASARATMVGALKAIAAWHDKRGNEAKRDVPSELRDIYPIVDKLAGSEFVELKLHAGKARETFFR